MQKGRCAAACHQGILLEATVLNLLKHVNATSLSCAADLLFCCHLVSHSLHVITARHLQLGVVGVPDKALQCGNACQTPEVIQGQS